MTDRDRPNAPGEQPSDSMADVPTEPREPASHSPESLSFADPQDPVDGQSIHQLPPELAPDSESLAESPPPTSRGDHPSEIETHRRVAERAELNFDQTDNKHNMTDTCGLAMTTQGLQDLGHADVSFDDVIDLGLERRLCDSNGSVSIDDVAELLGAFNEPAAVHRSQTVESLSEYVDNGHVVIAAVNAETVYGREPTSQVFGPNHAVFVTGVERTPDGQIGGFYVNDSGGWGDSPTQPILIPPERMEEGWSKLATIDSDSNIRNGGTMIVTARTREDEIG